MTAVPPAGPHGGDGAAVARALGLDPAAVLDLSQSLNPFAADVAALVSNHLDELRRYPGTAATARATAALAETIGTDPERLVLTNGGSEAIALVAGAMGGRVASEPEFALHPRGDGAGPRWRSNPHNPTGVLAAADDRAEVWDEAFYPLATGEWTRGDGAVVVGSLTKLFACPGLRLGYVLADDAPALTARQPAWPVNGLALAVLPDLLATADLPGWRSAIAGRRQDLARLLAGHGFAVAAGDAPWVLAQAPGLRERLAPQGVVVRDCASFGLIGWTRLAVPDDDGLARLDAALAATAATAEEVPSASASGAVHPIHPAAGSSSPVHPIDPAAGSSAVDRTGPGGGHVPPVDRTGPRHGGPAPAPKHQEHL